MLCLFPVPLRVKPLLSRLKPPGQQLHGLRYVSWCFANKSYHVYTVYIYTICIAVISVGYRWQQRSQSQCTGPPLKQELAERKVGYDALECNKRRRLRCFACDIFGYELMPLPWWYNFWPSLHQPLLHLSHKQSSDTGSWAASASRLTWRQSHTLNHGMCVCECICVCFFIHSFHFMSCHFISFILSLVYLSICLSVCLSVYLSIYASIVYLAILLSLYLSIYLSIYLSLSLSIYLSISLSLYLPTYLPACLPACLPTYLSLYSIYLCMCVYPLWSRRRTAWNTFQQCLNHPNLIQASYQNRLSLDLQSAFVLLYGDRFQLDQHLSI